MIKAWICRSWCLGLLLLGAGGLGAAETQELLPPDTLALLEAGQPGEVSSTSRTTADWLRWLANRAVFEIMQGHVPVDVMGDLGGLRNKIPGLGGDATLRGYDTNRFTDQVRYFSNTELRYTLGSQRLFRQYLEWTGVAFVDLGRVWPDLKALTPAAMHLTGGGGLRAYWNEDFVVSVESRFSAQQRTLAFTLGNIF